jgi:hypothetical protein
MAVIIKYLRYILIHKWYVFVECCKFGIPLMGIIHDMSKFSHCEFFQYARKFYGKYDTEQELRIRFPYGGIKTKESVDNEFNYAWLHHQKSNKHHWQYWILVYDNEPEVVVCLDIPLIHRKELLADWIGANKAINKIHKNNYSPRQWYQDNKHKIMLHPNTREWVEQQIEHL